MTCSELYLLRRIYLYAQEPMTCEYLSVVQELIRIKGKATNRATRATYNAALVHAVEKGHTEAAKCLLQAGANPTFKRDYAIRKAAENGHLNMVIVLLAAYNNIQSIALGRAINQAALHGHLQVVKYLHEAGVPAHNQAIFAAARNHHEHVVVYLESVGYSREELFRLE